MSHAAHLTHPDPRGLSPRRGRSDHTIPPIPLKPQGLQRPFRDSGERQVDAGQAAFAAGAALFAVDAILRAEPAGTANLAWLGAFRMRQALVAAAASAQLLRLREDERALRDAHCLTRAGNDPGPGGRLYRAWRELARRPTRLGREVVDRLARELGVPPLPDDHQARGEGSPIAAAAAEAASAAVPSSPEQEVVGLMAADLALAERLGWDVPVPLLATAIFDPALRTGPEGRRARPGDPGWALACTRTYARAAAAAQRRAAELESLAERFLIASRGVRTVGRADALGTVLADDAVSATDLATLGSDRAARRFLDRLVALGAARELTGRPTFRLYGL